jgi:hypothetical protein
LPLYPSGYIDGFTMIVGECPLDPGGYFVVKGTEKVTRNTVAIFSFCSAVLMLTSPATSPTTYCMLKAIVLMLIFGTQAPASFFMFSNDLAIYFDCQVVLIQEQLSKNRIIIDTDSKGRYYVYYIEFI